MRWHLIVDFEPGTQEETCSPIANSHGVSGQLTKSQRVLADLIPFSPDGSLTDVSFCVRLVA